MNGFRGFVAVCALTGLLGSTAVAVPVEIVVDNTDPNCTMTGTWATASSNEPFYGSNYAWCSTIQGTSEESATYKTRWTPELPAEGFYDVYIMHNSGASRSPSSYWKITNAGPVQIFRVDESVNPGWTLLAHNVLFSAGSSGFVEVMNNTGSTGQIVVADAVKFVSVPEPATLTLLAFGGLVLARRRRNR